jgi:hypothetical protein
MLRWDSALNAVLVPPAFCARLDWTGNRIFHLHTYRADPSDLLSQDKGAADVKRGEERGVEEGRIEEQKKKQQKKKRKRRGREE